MVGLFTNVVAGAGAGLSKGIENRGLQYREEARAKLRAEREGEMRAKERAADQDFAREKMGLGHQFGMERDAANNQASLERTQEAGRLDLQKQQLANAQKAQRRDARQGADGQDGGLTLSADDERLIEQISNNPRFLVEDPDTGGKRIDPAKVRDHLNQIGRPDLARIFDDRYLNSATDEFGETRRTKSNPGARQQGSAGRRSLESILGD